ncbi:MAG: hypothetical protein NC434_10885 [Ruminococcus sp.]|nr:hypothetical protein [Ruminococcus sp.]
MANNLTSYKVLCSGVNILNKKREREMDIEMMNKKESDHVCELMNKIVVAIEGTNCTYKDVMRAIDCVKNNYESKGRDLLNDIDIQKVAAFGALLK